MLNASRERKANQLDRFRRGRKSKDVQELRCQPYYCSHLQLRPGIMYSSCSWKRSSEWGSDPPAEHLRQTLLVFHRIQTNCILNDCSRNAICMSFILFNIEIAVEVSSFVSVRDGFRSQLRPSMTLPEPHYARPACLTTVLI